MRTTAIIRPDLVECLGALPAERMQKVEDQASQAFMLGLPARLACYVGLALFWRAHDLSIGMSTHEIIATLAPDLSFDERGAVASRLEGRRDEAINVIRAIRNDELLTTNNPAGAATVWTSDICFRAFLDDLLQALATDTSRVPTA